MIAPVTIYVPVPGGQAVGAPFRASPTRPIYPVRPPADDGGEEGQRAPGRFVPSRHDSAGEALARSTGRRPRGPAWPQREDTPQPRGGLPQVAQDDRSGTRPGRLAAPFAGTDRLLAADRLYRLVEEIDLDRAQRGAIFDFTV